MTSFGPDPDVLKALWLILAVEGQYMRVSWSPGAGLAPLELPEPVTEEQQWQRLVAELDAEELRGARRADVLAARVDEDGEPMAPAPALVSYDFAVDDGPGDWLRIVTRMCEDREVLLAAAARPRRGFGSCGSTAVLWARVEGKKDAQALARFRPRPTLLLREGSTSRYVAVWSLRRPLSYDWMVRGNKRIAHKLFAPKKWAGDAEFMFPCPGSCLRVGRARAVPVRLERFDPAALYVARDVVGKLKDAPDPNAWRAPAAA